MEFPVYTIPIAGTPMYGISRWFVFSKTARWVPRAVSMNQCRRSSGWSSSRPSGGSETGWIWVTGGVAVLHGDIPCQPPKKGVEFTLQKIGKNFPGWFFRFGWLRKEAKEWALWEPERRSVQLCEDRHKWLNCQRLKVLRIMINVGYWLV